MNMKSMVILPAVVSTGVVLILISLLVLLLTCCRCALLNRIKECYWRHKHRQQAQNGVFVVTTEEDEHQGTSNVIYKPKLSRQDPQHRTESTASFAQLESNNLNTENTEAVKESNYESIDFAGTESRWQFDVVDMMTLSGAEGQKRVETEGDEPGVEEEGQLGRHELDHKSGGDIEEDGDKEDDRGRGDHKFEDMQKHKTLHSDEAHVKTNVQYISMDRPTRGIRKCYTFCGAPTKPYTVEETENSETLLRLNKDFGNLSNLTRNSSSLTQCRPVPIARCSPFRTSKHEETELDDISKRPFEDCRRNKRNSKAEVFREPTMSLPKDQFFDNNPNERISDSSDDLFKDAWWRSSDSLDANKFLEEDLSPPTVCRRDPIHRQTAPNSIYVKMEVGSPQLSRPPSIGQRARSATMPSVLESNRSSMLSDLSLWYPHLTSNVQFTAELMPGLPKPCCGNLHYVNFRGTLPRF